MIDPLSSIFKGVLSGISSALTQHLLPKKQSQDKLVIEIQNNTIIENPKIETEVSKYPERFYTILELMNEKSYPQYSIAKLAQIMKLQKISELEHYFTGQKEPKFELLDKFCETFGVNKNWLIEGKGTPFANYLYSKRYSYPMYYLEEILKIKPERIIFVRENTETANTFVLIKMSDWKYFVTSKIWHISGHVGATGSSQLYSFYNFIIKLKEEGYYLDCGGMTLDTKDFMGLYSGEIFPRKYFHARKEDPWWDDLIDIYHQHTISSSYESLYGNSFIEAQKIIRAEHEYKQ